MLALKFILFFLRLQLKRNHGIDFEKNACAHLSSYPLWFLQKDCYKNPDFKSTVPSIIARNGYWVETYQISTKDGYIITLFRIPPRFTDSRETNKQPVFLQHGIAADSSTFVNIANRSLAFNLADLGYDVWLGNIRGTVYSKDHKDSLDDETYWDFNLDHMIDDIRVSLKQVAKVSNQNPIIYVGHSMGTTLAFMYAAEYPEEANRLLKGIIALAPVVYFDVKKYFVPLMNSLPLLARMSKEMSIYQMPKNPHATEVFYKHLCRIHPYICIQLLHVQYGKSYQLAPEDLILFFGAFLDSVCLEVVEHYGQMYKTDRFQKFDYGPSKNLQMYGTSDPPLYNLTRITIPVHLYFGKKDTLISERGLIKLYQQLGSKKKTINKVPKRSKEEKDQFNHIDFTFAKDIKRLFYDDLFELLSREL